MPDLKPVFEEQLHDAKRGVAVLVTCLVQTISEHDPAFKERFLERLANAYAKLREDETEALDRLELLSWTRELLIGFSSGIGKGGKGKPFLED